MKTSRRGFTLSEIVVVLVLLSITAGVALPALTDFGTGKPTHSVDRVLGLLRDVRRTAIERGVTASVLLDPTSRRYRVDTTGLTGVAGTLADTTLALDSAATLQADSARVRFLFFPNGAALADSLMVRDAGGRTIIRVEFWSGVARAYRR